MLNEVKRILFAAVITVITVPGAVHPNGESPPILQEVEFLATELKADISRLERRINEHGDRLSALTDESFEEVLQRLIDENPIGESVSAVVQEVEKLKHDVASIVARDGSILSDWIFPGVMGFIGGLIVVIFGKILNAISNSRAKLTTSSNHDPTTSPQTPETQEASVVPSYVGHRKKDNDKDSTVERRVVTHTEKETGTGNILTLCYPGADWSPRPIQEAIKDINERGIRYFARGPKGNEAEIEVHERLGKAYLKTKPDQHGGNNLGELPDPL